SARPVDADRPGQRLLSSSGPRGAWRTGAFCRRGHLSRIPARDKIIPRIFRSRWHGHAYVGTPRHPMTRETNTHALVGVVLEEWRRRRGIDPAPGAERRAMVLKPTEATRPPPASADEHYSGRGRLASQGGAFGGRPDRRG